MQKFNYHGHTYRCGHADVSISDEEYVKMFIEKGFEKIAFTDHCPYREVVDFRNNMRMDYSLKDDYYKSINELKEKYKDQIEIELGFEFEYVPGKEKYLFELKEETNKMVLGQHFVYDDEENVKIIGWGNTTDSDLINYARYIEKAMELKLADVVVHPDLFMIGKKTFGKIEEKVTRIICEAAERYQIPLEINLTRIALYLNKTTNDIMYPCIGFWQIASEYNIKVIYGVDAHFRHQINLYEDSVVFANEYIGKDVINKFNFCDKDL